MEKRIMNAVEQVYRNNDNYVQTKIVSLKNGSIFADLKMTFKRSDVTAMNELLTAVRKNSFGDIKVDKDSVTILNSGSCESSLCPNNSMCEIITLNTTYTCPCKNGFSSNGTQCEANIVVAVEIVVQRKFTEDLKNESSTEYIELKKNVTNGLTELFKDTSNFEKVIVTGFSNGSLKIKFKVIYRKPQAKEPKINKTVVAKTLREKATTGSIGNLKITADAIQIQQPPPPPKNVSADQVKEDQMLITWKEPDESEYYGIQKYIVSYKTLSETIFQTEEVVSQKLNRQLSDLKSDTYYVITVHAVNDEGDGEKSNTIRVRTQKEIDECKISSNCPQGFTCVNTIGSFSCVCKTEGYAQDKNKACIEVKKYQVQIRLKEDYHPQFNNQTSQEFKSMEKRIMNAVEQVYRNNDNYVQTKIVSLKNGSVSADLKMTFKRSDVTAMNELLTAVRKNSFGDIKVDKDSVTILNSGSCESDPSLCPNNSMCEIITLNTTYTCPCKNGFSSNGTQCEANIVVAVEIVVQRKFTEDLKNESSTEYIELKKNVTNGLTELFKDTSNFEKVIVTGFSNGSLKIKFEVIYRKPQAKEPKINKTVVAKTLREKATTGSIGNLKITAIQIQQPPPPPKNVSADQVKEDQMLITWKEPDESEYYGIQKYIVSYKTLSETIFQTEEVVSQKLNRQLSDLKSDTYYVITVHAVNDEGDGEKSNTIPVRTKKEINECENIQICPQGFTCVNTIGSYSCVCKTEGYAQDKNKACIEVKKYQVHIRLKEDYHPQLNNQTSQEFKSMEKRIMNAVEQVYRNNDNYVQTKIVSLKNGSVSADLKMTFKSSDVTAMNELLTAVRKNSFGDIEVDKDSVTILNSGSCESSLCPNNSKCEMITNTTYTCPCKNGFSSNGTQCEANIVVAVEIVVQRKFTEDLKNESSTEYIELKKNVTNELTKLFEDTPNFEKVIVTGFSNGSLKIKFKVIYRKPPAKDPKINKKVLVAKTLRKKAKTGFIGNLKITADAIQIQQSPPPPQNVSADQVKEDQILIIWKEPDESEFFGIQKYIVSYKTLSETKFQTKDVVSQKLNRQLSDLESDTYYVITVHGVNDEGHGEKSSTIQVRTLQEETDNNTVVIIVVVVIVMILLIVAVLVGLYCLRKKKRLSMRQEPKYANPVKLQKLSKTSDAFGNPSYDNFEQCTTENF